VFFVACSRECHLIRLALLGTFPSRGRHEMPHRPGFSHSEFRTPPSAFHPKRVVEDADPYMPYRSRFLSFRIPNSAFRIY
jgi:hypothetical protein